MEDANSGTKVASLAYPTKMRSSIPDNRDDVTARKLDLWYPNESVYVPLYGKNLRLRLQSTDGRQPPPRLCRGAGTTGEIHPAHGLCVRRLHLRLHARASPPSPRHAVRPGPTESVGEEHGLSLHLPSPRLSRLPARAVPVLFVSVLPPRGHLHLLLLPVVLLLDELHGVRLVAKPETRDVRAASLCREATEEILRLLTVRVAPPCHSRLCVGGSQRRGELAHLD